MIQFICSCIWSVKIMLQGEARSPRHGHGRCARQYDSVDLQKGQRWQREVQRPAQQAAAAPLPVSFDQAQAVQSLQFVSRPGFRRFAEMQMDGSRPCRLRFATKGRRRLSDAEIAMRVYYKP